MEQWHVSEVALMCKFEVHKLWWSQSILLSLEKLICKEAAVYPVHTGVVYSGFRCSILFCFRLTKYPLLFENLAKYTEEDTEELVSVLRAVERSKEILNHVNQAVREAEDYQRLADIQRRLEKSGFDKLDHPMAGECKVCGSYLVYLLIL